MRCRDASGIACKRRERALLLSVIPRVDEALRRLPPPAEHVLRRRFGIGEVRAEPALIGDGRDRMEVKALHQLRVDALVSAAAERPRSCRRQRATAHVPVHRPAVEEAVSKLAR